MIFHHIVIFSDTFSVYCFFLHLHRGSEAAPAKMPPPVMSMGPSPFVYNSMPTGVILKQNTNQSAGSLYYPGDGQSLTGYPGNTGNPGSRYMFYEETDNGAVNTLGMCWGKGCLTV